MPARTQRVGIADVARVAGVSKTAVSFAFNKPDQLSPTTAGRILEVAATLGYRPHPVARALARRRTMSIGVMTPQPLSTAFANPYFGTFSVGVAAVAEDAGYELHFISPDRGSLERAMDRATVDGLVVIGLRPADVEVQRLRSAGIPLVFVDSTAMLDAPSVSVDDEGGADAAAAHILDLGHRDVLFILMAPTAPDPPTADRGVGPDRLRGYDRAFRDRGLSFPTATMTTAPSTIEGGRTAFSAAWAGGAHPTAVVAMSDAIAVGVLSAASSLGLRVPDDLSVIGFDDLEIAAHTDPPLTTVHQPIRAKGEAAMRLLLALLAGGDPDPDDERVLATYLVVRASTAAPRGTPEA